MGLYLVTGDARFGIALSMLSFVWLGCTVTAAVLPR